MTQHCDQIGSIISTHLPELRAVKYEMKTLEKSVETQEQQVCVCVCVCVRGGADCCIR